MKKLTAYINAENETVESVVTKAQAYENSGIDELFIFNHTEHEKEIEEFLGIVKEVVRSVDVPVIIGDCVKRFEDVKKAFYTGAKIVVIRYRDIKDAGLMKEAVERFGSEHIYLEVNCAENEFFGSGNEEELRAAGFGGIILKHVELDERIAGIIASETLPVVIRDSLIRNDIESLITIEGVSGIATNYYDPAKRNIEGYPYEDGEAESLSGIMKIKHSLKRNGIEVNTFDTAVPFDGLKKNSDGMVPVIVQDYKNNEVLMLAYMDEEAYNKTVETGIMTYYSRSRKELWVKGKTSGHYQYVKELIIDCDKDTILAKVQQIGAACHTGNRSCFYTTLVKHEYEERNPYRILAELYNTVMDRKANPKEGSYTNYLFSKGIDKILKKCGEEATEIVIAAKNPGSAELKYEIADFLYHMTVLMAECGVDWEDIVKELADRH